MTRAQVVPSHSFEYDENGQELRVRGVLAPAAIDEMRDLLALLQGEIARARGRLTINLRSLRRMNLLATSALAGLILREIAARPDLSIDIVTSSVLPWARRRLSRVMTDAPRVTVRDYDEALYPGQGVLEDESFVPILRTQTRMTWRHEKTILARHGLEPGMRVADICCGIGDFAALVARTFAPRELLALDHSHPSLAYARRAAAELGVEDVSYVYGDAADMLIESDRFDFVTCRHSLQVFGRPELILSELCRICRPGGRVYITNEKNSHCLGEPRADTIRWTYNEVARLWADFGMDIELGPKSRRMLVDAGLEDVRIECFMVTNLDGDPKDFADVIASWEAVYVDRMAVARGDDPAFIARFRQGFRDHIATALDPRGYAGWPIWVASGRKPV